MDDSLENNIPGFLLDTLNNSIAISEKIKSYMIVFIDLMRLSSGLLFTDGKSNVPHRKDHCICRIQGL